MLLQAPGGFPASAPAAQPSSPGAAGSGKQLETTRTAVPVEVEKSNAAAASPTAAATGMQKLAGKQLELSGSAVPPDVQDSNAAASQVMDRCIMSLIFMNGGMALVSG